MIEEEELEKRPGYQERVKSLERYRQDNEEIAQRHKPLTLTDYLDHLIEAEELEKRPRWQRKVTALKRYKQDYELIANIHAGKFKPFQEYEDELKQFMDAQQVSYCKVSI